MFRKKPQEVDNVVSLILRSNGLETPLLQRRLVKAWEETVGEDVTACTVEKRIKNQTLWVKINNPAIRADLQMQRSTLVKQLNGKVGAQIICDIKIY